MVKKDEIADLEEQESEKLDEIGYYRIRCNGETPQWCSDKKGELYSLFGSMFDASWNYFHNEVKSLPLSGLKKLKSMMGGQNGNNRKQGKKGKKKP